MLHNHAEANGTAPSDPSRGAAAIDTSPTLRQVCLELQAKVDAFLAEDADTKLLRGLQAQVKEAVGVIDEALDRYSVEELSLSYNGGKDCLVLLVLILACLPRHYEETSSVPSSSSPATTIPSATGTGTSTGTSTASTAINRLTAQIPTNTPAPPTPVRPSTPQPFPSTLQSVYIVSPQPFAEVDDFVDESVAKYHLELCRYSLPMRAALEEYLKERPRVKAVFVGTRRTDPHGASLTHFDQTDKDWPEFMRVHPVIDWHYAEIWAFIRLLDIPYLSLYDQGYTSLGGTKDTHPNPLLKREGEGEGFRPAYELLEDNEERLGRDR
ncbi:putative FAD synthase [Cytospora mali]|uniref:FAD synthase n=1 Tax=Cytospora mali TaxID=578113 RepID=A0A194VI09_CYTMA|nr:putative FAD synthase [Valsa mali]